VEEGGKVRESDYLNGIYTISSSTRRPSSWAVELASEDWQVLGWNGPDFNADSDNR